jgi:hypothetical protein
LRQASLPGPLQQPNSQNRASGLSGGRDVFGLDALVLQPAIGGYSGVKLGRMFSFVRIRKLEEQSSASDRLGQVPDHLPVRVDRSGHEPASV